MNGKKSQTRIFILVMAWLGVFTTLNVLKYVIATNLGTLETSFLFTATDALIATVPIVVWLLVVFDWDKFSVGPVSFERRMRKRLSDELDPRSIQTIRVEDLELSKADEIGNPETNAVRVVVGESEQGERYEDLLYFVGGKGEEKIDWRHIQYVFLTDKDGKLIGTMGPRRFRSKLLYGGVSFRNALRTKEQGRFLDFGDEIHVKETDSKSGVLRLFAKHQLLWFPVVDEAGTPIGVIEPGRLAVSVLTDIAEVLSDN